MNQIIFLISLYVLTQTGYFLGKTTKEEHKEIKKFTKQSILILTNIFYGVLFAIFYNTKYVFLIVGLYTLYVVSFKKQILKPFHNILLLGIGFNLLNLTLVNMYMYILILFVFALTLENSFKKIDYKEISYEIIILIIIYFIFSIL